jgi:monofunctional biosynthetic peptidoglycan transglycosylase
MSGRRSDGCRTGGFRRTSSGRSSSRRTARFFQHEGIDVEQIRKSLEDALEKGDAPRGASTITQQLAKNLYLSPSRDPMRKLRELISPGRLEAALPKARILEIYLNVVEWGDGIWGAEAASRAYFGVPAANLSRAQAALLAGALINPIRYSPGHPPARLLRRQQIILSRMGGVEPPPPVATPGAAPEPSPEPVSAPAEASVETSRARLSPEDGLQAPGSGTILIRCGARRAAA